MMWWCGDVMRSLCRWAFSNQLRACWMLNIQMIVLVTLSFSIISSHGIFSPYLSRTKCISVVEVFSFCFVLVARKKYFDLPIYLSSVLSLLLRRSVAFIHSLWPAFSHSVIHVNMSLWQLRNCSLMMYLKFRLGVCFVYLHRYNLEARFERTHSVYTFEHGKHNQRKYFRYQYAWFDSIVNSTKFVKRRKKKVD